MAPTCFLHACANVVRLPSQPAWLSWKATNYIGTSVVGTARENATLSREKIVASLVFYIRFPMWISARSIEPRDLETAMGRSVFKYVLKVRVPAPEHTKQLIP